MASKSSLAPITNPLVTSNQLLHFKSTTTSSVPSNHFATFILTQAAGILLRLPQETIATAIILLQRYLIGSASTTVPATEPQSNPPELYLLSSAALYLSSKLSSLPISSRNLFNVYAFLTSPAGSPLAFINPSIPIFQSSSNKPPASTSHYISEGTLDRLRPKLFTTESLLLQSLAFRTHVALPHPLALTYLSALGVSSSDHYTRRLSARVISHLNAALLSPQYLYLTCQPNALAVAAIYLAAREEGVKLVAGVNWWEAFDVGREELGFLVVGLGGLAQWAEDEFRRWTEGGEGAGKGVTLGAVR